MKKKALFITMILCTMALAVGCKGTNKDADKTTTATTPAEVKDYSSFVKLGDYKGVEVEVEAIEVTEDEIDAQIQIVLDEKATTKEITDRAIKEGDIANIDYEGLLDGVAFEGGTAAAFDLTIGSGTFIEGFEEQLIGVKKGEKVSLDVTFPEDYQSTDLAGKAVVFKVTVNTISEKTVSVLDEAFVKANTDYDTVEDYKASVKTELETSKKEAAENTKKNSVMEAVVKNATISEYPQEEIDKFLQSATEYYTEQATSSGTDFATFLTSNGMTQEQFNEQFTEYGKQTTATKMVAQAVAKKEKIDITEEEYQTGLSTYSESYGITSEQLIQENGESTMREQVLFDKVVDFLVKNAVEKEVTATEAPAATSSAN